MVRFNTNNVRKPYNSIVGQRRKVQVEDGAFLDSNCIARSKILVTCSGSARPCQTKSSIYSSAYKVMSPSVAGPAHRKDVPIPCCSSIIKPHMSSDLGIIPATEDPAVFRPPATCLVFPMLFPGSTSAFVVRGAVDISDFPMSCHFCHSAFRGTLHCAFGLTVAGSSKEASRRGVHWDDRRRWLLAWR